VIIYIDMDDVLCDYSRAFNKAIKETPTIAFPQSQYGFYANVNPLVDHPRWSQASERRITTGGLFQRNRIDTLPFNGYAQQVAHLYKNMNLTRFF